MRVTPLLSQSGLRITQFCVAIDQSGAHVVMRFLDRARHAPGTTYGPMTTLSTCTLRKLYKQQRDRRT